MLCSYMGKTLDALFGRSFETSKFKAILNLAISRLTVLKNQRQARFRQSRSEVLQLLQLGHHERALLRVEHVIKDQNMLDVYDKIEVYCYLLIERVHLIEQERECPEELKEAASGLIYVASRCGDFPEIQKIRAILTSRFGREFAARAVELRNNCGVHPQIIQKLSTRMPSLENRMKAVHEIASENSLVLLLEEPSFVSTEEKFNVEKQNQHETEIREEENLYMFPGIGIDKEFTDSFKARQKFKDAADAAQAAFESAAYAAAAARAAVKLSRSVSCHLDDCCSPKTPNPKPRKVLDGYDSSKLKSQVEDKEILSENQGEFNKNAKELEEPKDILSSNSSEDILKVATVFVDTEIEVGPFEKDLVFLESDDESHETDNEQKRNQSSKQISSMYHAGTQVRSGSSLLVSNAVSGFKMQNTPHLNLEKRPLSVRTRSFRY